MVRKLRKHWCDSHQDTLGPHIYSFAGKNSRVALKTRRHGLVSPWLAKRQRAKKGPATGCTAWTCARNANRRLISPNIALQRDSRRRGFQIFFDFQTHYFQSHNWKILFYIYLHSFQMLSKYFKIAVVFFRKKTRFPTQNTGHRHQWWPLLGATKPLNRRHRPEVFLHCLRCIQGLGGTLQKALGRVSRPFGGCD